MKKASGLIAAIIGISFLCIGFLINLLSLNASFILVHGSIGLDFAIILSIILILFYALEVKKFLDGKKPDLKPNKAVFALLLSQSGFYSGSAILGILIGGFISISIFTKGVLLTLHLSNTIISAFFAILLIGAGLFGQRLCKTKPPENKA
ncbi:MAG: DUF3180 domain-containing protein [Bifidobacteriaceae bacterium]|jgi:hypothetical protein|nr:DUF3180 domain-containing protein [Bifidobacteriaceae bacterium]